ncbi:alanine racemase [Litoribacter ruber]|uniref:Alanine racemase n=1 Tax=Litoribacter ruber TaxID=702568 RepID=A0AAP2G4T2_9BACT|nr:MULTISPECIES: alanine racemase [Litoribacter]MBS9524825.1 alanine racemase [Litoribacter alkaliphilus]MBT0812592.1 alanine racemase [Litoribacter ruber]
MLDFQIKNPTLILDEAICRRNLKKMAVKAKSLNLKLAPHFKTHQSLKVAEWCKDYEIDEISVSSFRMAFYFRDRGFKNIHIAFPFNPLLIEDLSLMQGQPVSIQLVNEEVARLVSQKVERSIGFFIEIDAGYGRTGVPVENFEVIDNILRVIAENKNMNFKGFYIHAGHTYHANLEGIKKIHKENQEAFRVLKAKYQSQYPELVCRSGDTPSASLMENFDHIDELGPGNFVFYDLTQAAIGSCNKEDIAVALASPVVDVKVGKNEILIHGGGVHLSKDVLNDNEVKNFGEVVLFEKDKWIIPAERAFLKSISQEHGLIHAPDALMERIKIGDVIGILPIHSCMTADCMRSYRTLDNDLIDHLEGTMK